VEAALGDAGLGSERLVLEVTESTAMTHRPEERRILRVLRDLGVRLAIDDFGTGYASLGRLRRSAVDALKVDGSFVAGLDREPESRAIVRAVTGLAHDLGLTVTAEWVETAEQAGHLHALGVDFGQGYHFARPLPDGEIAALLARGPRLPGGTGVEDRVG
jgi:EAL domain-containing protein (putative c-di-GMP-specific phosphodiesterase class I)